MVKKNKAFLIVSCLICLMGYFLHPAALKMYKASKSVQNAMPSPEQIINNKSYAKKLFSQLEKETALISKPMYIASSDLNKEKNRHPSFLPFDCARTCRDIEGFYISASDVNTPKQAYIIAQGPTEKTVGDFWKMIFYKKCTLIASLCMPNESGKDKCCPYWEKPFLPEEILGWRLLSTREYVIKQGLGEQKIVHREFLFEQENTRKTHQVTQLHYQEWPDFGVPQCDLFCVLLDCIDSLADKDTPIVVHCSAGIGRSGTLVASHSLKKELADGGNPNVLQRIYEMRQQRANVVTNTAQFQFIYQALYRENMTVCD